MAIISSVLVVLPLLSSICMAESSLIRRLVQTSCQYDLSKFDQCLLRQNGGSTKNSCVGDAFLIQTWSSTLDCTGSVSWSMIEGDHPCCKTATPAPTHDPNAQICVNPNGVSSGEYALDTCIVDDSNTAIKLECVGTALHWTMWPEIPNCDTPIAAPWQLWIQPDHHCCPAAPETTTTTTPAPTPAPIPDLNEGKVCVFASSGDADMLGGTYQYMGLDSQGRGYYEKELVIDESDCRWRCPQCQEEKIYIRQRRFSFNWQWEFAYKLADNCFYARCRDSGLASPDLCDDNDYNNANGWNIMVEYGSCESFTCTYEEWGSLTQPTCIAEKNCV